MTTATEEKPEVEVLEEAAPAPPERVSLKYLLSELNPWRYGDFEQWAQDFWLNSTTHFYTQRVRFHSLERLSLASEALEAERLSLEAWGVDVAEFAFLAAACGEAPALDYSDPLTLKYFALWVWAGDHAEAEEGAEEGAMERYERRQDIRGGAIPWSAILNDELLSLAAFNCAA